jgi:putative Holliday junction resolvase
MRILGLDYGTKTVGVAMSDPLLLTAQGIEIIRREHENKLRRTYARIEELVKENGVEKIVLGYPRNMDDSEGERCLKTKEFRDDLIRRTGLPVILWDERLTTVAADEIMMEAGLGPDERKKHVDKIAAVIILQEYLEFLRSENNKNQ